MKENGWMEVWPFLLSGSLFLMTKDVPRYPSFNEALLFWLKLGFISFGGPAGQIAIMHEFLVEKKKWISERKFLHALNYCMILPGPEAQQLATYSGWLLHGVKGGLVAGLLFILPSVFILWGLSMIYVTYGQTLLMGSMLEFLKPAVIAIIIAAMFKIAKRSLITPLHYALAGLAFFCIYFLNVPFPLIIIGSLLMGGIIVRFFPQQLKTIQENEMIRQNDEAAYVINQESVIRGVNFSWKRILKQILVFGLLWLIPMGLIYLSDVGLYSFWEKLSLFFTKAAFVTFGGAYAVLPYVAQVSVESFGWLTKYQMIDGLALGETTPGPLIMVLSFVGFMAGYNTFAGNIEMATIGLVMATYFTFLPSFLFIFVGAPLIEKTQTNSSLKSLFGFATAAVTGVILSLGIYFGKAVIIPAPPEILWIPLAWTIISFVALRYFKINMILWIAVSLVAGLIKFGFHLYAK